MNELTIIVWSHAGLKKWYPTESPVFHPFNLPHQLPTWTFLADQAAFFWCVGSENRLPYHDVTDKQNEELAALESLLWWKYYMLHFHWRISFKQGLLCLVLALIVSSSLILALWVLAPIQWMCYLRDCCIVGSLLLWCWLVGRRRKEERLQGQWLLYLIFGLTLSWEIFSRRSV